MRFHGLPDEEILKIMQSGGPVDVADGFRELVMRYQDRIVNYLVRHIGDRATAEDLAQEAFLRVHRNLERYDRRNRFSTWLYTIATNLAKDEFKRRSSHPAQSLDWVSSGQSDTTRTVPTALADEGQNPEGAAQRDEDRDLVHEALRRLKPDDREVLILRDLQGLSYDEIATILDVPIGTLKSRISRARQAFAAAWRQLVRA
jgi:RNA polymerase sigma-70 factor (ECF subfamily)